MKFVILNMVAGSEMIRGEDQRGEDDGDDVMPSLERREITKQVAVRAKKVRDFYPRKNNAPGTRVMFDNGSALAVTEPFEKVLELLEAAQD